MDNVKKTALYDTHIRYGGKMVDFAGWMLPVQYEGVIGEHEAVRNAAGMFDVSHMGEVEITGSHAQDFVQHLVTNDIRGLNKDQVIYTLMCYPDGGVVDDLLIYHFGENHYFLVINASNIEKDVQWMKDQAAGYEIELVNRSSEVSEVAVQGPKAQQILQKLTETNLEELLFFYCKREVILGGIRCMISRTGYTGEDGFEIYTFEEGIDRLWDQIMEAGKDDGVKPCGLGCRDTLRFEAALPLYGNEISATINPLEAGLGYFVKLDKGDFIGREILLEQKAAGLKRKEVGFEMVDRAIPRHGYEVLKDHQVIGVVTTGSYSPTLKKNIGIALIDAKHGELGAEFQIQVRNKPMNAVIISKKFYQKKTKQAK